MIQVILGSKGSGKTKRLLDLTNEALTTEQGNGTIIFIDDDARYMYDLNHAIRFVNAADYPCARKCSSDRFLAFVSGMLAADFDITMVSIDAFKKLVTTPLEELEGFFKELNRLSADHGCRFVLSISEAEENVPEFIRQYKID